MFVTEIIPGLWVCDYDIAQTHYFNTRNIRLYIHIYSYKNDYADLSLNYNQQHIEICIKNIITNSDASTILRQNTQYAEDYGRKIIDNIKVISDILDRMHGVVIYSKYGIQKATTFACGYLIAMGNLQTDNALKIMHSKEPLCFKNPQSLDREDHIVLYRDALKYIEFKY
jgi:hypothetical protein